MTTDPKTGHSPATGTADAQTAPSTFDPQAVIAFWREVGPAKWFSSDPAFDEAFKQRFMDAHLAAARRELDGWAESAEGSLALLILLDQFPRNAFRHTAHMFATDALARRFTRQAIARGHDRADLGDLRPFFYMALEHSESLEDQEAAVRHLTEVDEDSARWARVHRDIIQRFGRFPHRNRALGRDTTPREQAFLDAGGFAG